MRLLIFIIMISLSSVSNSFTRLNLQCVMSSSNFSELDDVFEVREVSLAGVKNKIDGTEKVFDFSGYEMWAMVHTLQKTENTPRILNFQVAVKKKGTNSFFHALSNTVNEKDEPLSARISLVEYAEDSFLEVGEIFFECKQKNED